VVAGSHVQTVDCYLSGRALQVSCEYVGVCRYEMGAVPALSLVQRSGKAMRSRVGWGVRAWEVQWQHPSLEGNTV